MEKGKRIDLGVYERFYVSTRNGCPIYDEPYYVFQKDGKEHMESVLDLRYYKMSLYQADAPYHTRLTDDEIAAFPVEYEGLIDKGIVPDENILHSELEKYNNKVQEATAKFTKLLRDFNLPTQTKRGPSWLDDDFDVNYSYIYQVRNAKQEMERQTKLLHRYKACLKLGIFKAEENGKYADISSDKELKILGPEQANTKKEGIFQIQL